MGPLYGEGMRIIRPVSRIFNIKNIPILFRSCSPYCKMMFMNNTESLTDLLYGNASVDQMAVVPVVEAWTEWGPFWNARDTSSLVQVGAWCQRGTRRLLDWWCPSLTVSYGWVFKELKMFEFWITFYWNVFLCVSLKTLVIIGLDSGLVPNRHQATAWANDDQAHDTIWHCRVSMT